MTVHNTVLLYTCWNMLINISKQTANAFGEINEWQIK